MRQHWLAIVCLSLVGCGGGGGSEPSKSTPVAVDLSVNALEDKSVSFAVLGSGARQLIYRIQEAPQHGTIVGVLPDVVYEPNKDYFGADSFTYTVSDGASTSPAARVNINIAPVNDPPRAHALQLATIATTPVELSLSADDIDSDTLNHRVLTPPAGGALNGNTPNLVYTAHPNFYGTDTFTFVSNDGSSDSQVSTVSIIVLRNNNGSSGGSGDNNDTPDDPNDPNPQPDNNTPTANSFAVTTPEDGELELQLSGQSPTQSGLVYQITQNPARGQLIGTPPLLRFRPNANYHGSDQFSYTVNNGHAESSPATVSITITSVNDPPLAHSMTLAVNQDTASPLQLMATDIDSNVLTYVITQQPTHGLLSGTPPTLSYQPDNGYTGADLVEFTVTDNAGASNSASVIFNIIPSVNDPQATNEAPIAAPLTLQTNEDSDLQIALLGTDTDSSTLSYEITQQPQQGTLIGVAPSLTYRPAANVNGVDSFSYRVSDGVSQSAPATVAIAITPVNDSPSAKSLSVITDQEKTLTIALQASDIDSSNLIYTVLSLPAQGTLSGNPPALTYLPNAGFFGTDSFTYKANDGQANSTVATITITVNKVNKPPQSKSITAAVDEDGQVPLQLQATDPDSTTLSYRITRDPAHGIISGIAPNITYSPAVNYSGPDSFEYTASDGFATSNVAVVALTVTPINDAPTTLSEDLSTRLETPLVLQLKGDDIDGDALNYAISSSPTHGQLSGIPPQLTYIPNNGYSGRDTFTFTASDTQLQSPVATINIDVINNLPPVLSGDPPSTIKANLTYNFKPTVSDPDGDTLTFAATNLPLWLTLNSQTGLLSGIPSNNDVGITPMITLSVKDSHFTVGLPLFQITVQQNPWEIKANMMSNKRRAVAINLDGKIHIIGGASDIDGALTAFAGKLHNVYDTSNNSWIAEPPLNTGLIELTGHAIDGKLYVFGGLGVGGTFANSTQIYDPASTSWGAGQTMPTTRARFTSNVIHDIVYVAGGVTSNWLNTNTLEAYDPSSNTWSKKAAMPAKCSQLASAVLNDKLYVMGGWCDTTSKAVYVYDPTSDQWTTGKSMNQARRYHVAEALSNTIYVMGGYGDAGLDSAEEYDPASDTWTPISQLLKTKFAMSAAAHAGLLYLFGGQSDNQMFTNHTWVYDPAKEQP
jgi:N-acetylneuraminic acid mutarotase